MRKLFLGTAVLLIVTACSGGSKTVGSTTTTTVTTATTATTATTLESGTDPQSVVQRYIDAMNRGDGATAVALFAEDASYTTLLGHCTPCVGRDSFEANLLNAAGHVTGALTSVVVKGDTLTAQGEIRSPSFPSGIDRVIGSFSAVVRGGLIVSLEQDFDQGDPQTEALLVAAGLQSSAAN